METQAATLDVTPAPGLLAEAEMFDRLLEVIRRYVVMTPEQSTIVALWVVHAHCVERFEQTPYLNVTSPEKQCGKSRLLELLELLVPRPWMAITPSEAVVYRHVSAEMPTLLLDEVDAIFAPRTADRYEGLRAILNTGHRRGATVPRCVGPTQQLASFEVYCAKVLAGIGTLPDTITDRSIPIRLQRKRRGEWVERFRLREAREHTEPLRADLERWAERRGEAMASARPNLPEELSDRMQEGCEPLLAIADELGVGVETRAALVSLLAGEREDSTEAAQARLLRDVRWVFVERFPASAALRTETLLARLNPADGCGWGGTWYGRELNARDLANLLKPYGITPRSVREGELVGNGYRRDQFADAWGRYLTNDADDADDADDVVDVDQDEDAE
jgi:Protein of unknown function (DUF3631)